MPLAAGTRLGPYEILSPLGAGGMGEVYRARDTRLGREVAVKVLPEHLARDPAALARFEREARAVAALSHPNILALYDVGCEQGVSYAVLELLEGETLRQRLQAGALPWRKAVEIAAATAEGLSAAHPKGITHRDLKPENIFLTSDGRVKILDFGLARFRPPVSPGEEPSAPTETEVGTVMGTVGYMSPEQVRGAPAEAPSDIFSLGCVLYEMLAGDRPFGRRNASDILAAILRDDPPPLATSGKQIPPELDRLTARCLEKNPGERFQSARDLSFALKDILHGSERGAPAPVQRAHRFSRAVWPAMIFVLLLLAGSIYWLLQPRAGAGSPIDSIAVLPFANSGGSPDSEYLSDGITESLMNSLSRLPNLRVIGRSSVFRYKGKEPDPQAVAQALKVRAVLTGRVIQRGEDLSISADLVEAQDNRHLWGGHYRGKMADIFSVQEQIANEITENLRLRLSGEQKKGLGRRYTQNAEAYQDYLKGRYFWNKRTEASLRTATEYFEKAIARDPAYALAWAGLADCYVVISNHAAVPPRESYPKAKAAALEALKMDDTIAEAHVVLGAVKHRYEWDWAGGERDYQRGLQLNPDYPVAHQWYSHYFLAMGRFEEARAQIQRAQDLDPLSLTISAEFAEMFSHLRRYDEGIEHIRKTLAMDPNFGMAHTFLGLAHSRKFLYPEAIAEFQTALQLREGDWTARAFLGHAYARSGNKAAAQKILHDLTERSKRGYFPSLAIAWVYLGLGDKDQAFERLGKALEERGLQLLFLKSDSLYDPLRSDPRFTALLRRMNLAP